MTRDLSAVHFWEKERTKIDISKFREVFSDDKILENEEMNRHTTFRIGGRADVMLLPSDETEIRAAVKICRDNKMQYIVIGNASNILVSDKGYRGVVIKLGKNFTGISTDGEAVTAKAGTLLSSIASAAAASSLTGLEFASGIPGSVGGAVFMNAGAYGGEMKDVVQKTSYIDSDGEIKILKQHGFGYRKSVFQENGGIILETEMKLTKGDSREILEKMERFNSARREKQPLNFPSAGSAFKRPEGYVAAKLIDDAGLRGYRIGGAQVSEKHTGFIVNCGGATAEDALKLMEYIKHTVYEKFSVMLESEIRFLGER